MGAPIGNQNKKGKPSVGSGRHGAGRELLDQQFLEELFFTEVDFEDLEARIKGKKKTFGDMMLYMALKGNDRVVTKLIDKMFPDSRRILRPLDREPLTDDEKVEFAKQIDRAFEEFSAIGYKPKLRLNGNANPASSQGSADRRTGKKARTGKR